jgi:hypothetical protein
MKRLIPFAKIIGLLLLSASCQKVIDIDLNETNAKLIIEGIITDDSAVAQTVRISKSVNFSERNEFPGVSNANVTIIDNLGNSVSLAETSPGVYQTKMIAGVSGRTYSLNVFVEGKNYNATSTMPQKINLDNITIDAGVGPGLPNAKVATPIFTDPLGLGNNYRFKLKKNKEESKSIFILDDLILDGGTNTRALTDPTLEFESGDTATVTMMCVDAAVRLYFFSLNQNGSGPDASAAPANPVSNIKGGSLGYFSAHTIQTKKVIVQ